MSVIRQWSLLLMLIACVSGTTSHAMQRAANRYMQQYVTPTVNRASGYVSRFWRPTEVPAQASQPSYYQKPTWYGRLYDRFNPAGRLPMKPEGLPVMTERMSIEERLLNRAALKDAEEKAMIEAQRVQAALKETGLNLMRERRRLNFLQRNGGIGPVDYAKGFDAQHAFNTAIKRREIMKGVFKNLENLKNDLVRQ
jgi:hypothetical protein